MAGAQRPRWFVDALAAGPTERFVEVDGCAIHYLGWGEPGRPGLVLVHGGAAHAHWWSFLAPQLAEEYRVAALDLSGHGDSGRRPDYPGETWAREVMAVAEDARCGGPPIVVGHSMGGWVAIITAAEQGDDLAGIVVLDSPVRQADPELEAAAAGREFGRLRAYPDLATAMARFRTVPAQESSLPYVLEHVARHSLHRVDDGWTWKFDPRIFDRAVPSGALLRRVTCRVALFRAEHGLVTADIGRYMYEELGRVAPVVEVPEAYHHLMLDQPLSLLTGLRTLLADWEHSVPHPRA